jgi:CBS domain containing-hemolysin-like protein
MESEHGFETMTFAVRLGATLFFVLLNGFFVAAEFAFVTVRGSRVEVLAKSGSGRARIAQGIVNRLDLYLSACQFGITVSSLILGWLAEPAIAELLMAGAHAAGWPLAESAMLHWVALAIALTIVTTLHMTLGEQAPKMWAIQNSERGALFTARPLKIFTFVFGPLISVINSIANWMLRVVGISPAHGHGESFSADELKSILAASADAGNITARQREFAENILGLIDLQVRHILVPRVDVVWLALDRPLEENLRTLRESEHTRLPLCREDLDSVIGIVHAKNVMAVLSEGRPVDLEKLAREPVYVPDTQPLGRMIVEMQQAQARTAIVLDDHGTAIGMVFLEDAIEEIVGPIHDEFDDAMAPVVHHAPDRIEVRGEMPLPEAAELLGLQDIGTDDTIGGHVVSLLKRLPVEGDQLTLGSCRATVMEVSQRRIVRLCFEQAPTEESDD